jgi:hypothetical protein
MNETYPMSRIYDFNLDQLFVVAEHQSGGWTATDASNGVVYCQVERERTQMMAQDICSDLNSHTEHPYDPETWAGKSLSEIEWIGDHIEAIALFCEEEEEAIPIDEWLSKLETCHIRWG